MKAMILAAGKGTRLGKLTETTPKALIDINGKTLLRLAVEKCSAAGFDNIIINVHHFADQVENEVKHLNKAGFRISISDERNMLLETGGGLFNARDFFDKDPFLLYNADIVTDFDISDLYNYHQNNKSLATLAVRNRKGNRYFLVDRNGRLRGWYNKATSEKIISNDEPQLLSEIAFSGMHIIDPEIFKYMSKGVYTMTALYLQLASSHIILTFRCDKGYWFDLGSPEKLEEVRNFLI